MRVPVTCDVHNTDNTFPVTRLCSLASRLIQLPATYNLLSVNKAWMTIVALYHTSNVAASAH